MKGKATCLSLRASDKKETDEKTLTLVMHMSSGRQKPPVTKRINLTSAHTFSFLGLGEVKYSSVKSRFSESSKAISRLQQWRTMEDASLMKHLPLSL